MKKYPIGIQDYQEICTGGYLYIDKTESIYKLIESGKYFFLSRPRRFGKSLLLSTLKYFFQGKKELFQGLWVDKNTSHDWKEFPVLHFSFSSLSYKDIGLERALQQALNLQAEHFGIELKREGLGQRFQELIKHLGNGDQKLVILIDEYDKPIIDYIDKYEQAEENRDTLKNFFSVIKDCDPYLRFFFITGVSKFSKVSLFSDLNHLRDLTILDQYAELAGYTQAELDLYFDDDLERMAVAKGQSKEQMRETIKRWYNGYKWGKEASTPRLYNPFSILNCFASDQINNYWWETGTPTFLMRMLRKNMDFKLDELEVGGASFESYTLDNLESTPLLFQTGYLTIKDYDDENRLFTLGFPNMEVKEAFLQHLLAAYRETGSSLSYSLFIRLKKTLQKGDLKSFIEVVNQLFATIPYQIFISDKEAFFHAILHLSFSGLGLVAQSEVSTSRGRVDTIVHLEDRIYILEFKLDESAEAALAQIRQKAYGTPFLSQGKEVIAMGISFSSETKSVADWQDMPYIELLAEG